MINFQKLEGIGNDFILLDSRVNSFMPTAKQAVKWCDRRFGIGADGILVLLKPKRDADFKMRILNSDGSEPEMCGNGIRCLAQYVYSHNLTQKPSIKVETIAGPVNVEKQGELFRVALGRPDFDPKKVPVKSKEPVIRKTLSVGGKDYKVTCLSVGNPHCVIVVPKVDKVPLAEVGPLIENYKWFPKRVNVEFVQVVSKKQIKMRVWERGAGETLACGTGACAAVAACAKMGLTDNKVKVSLPGGELTIDWKEFCFLTGPARFVYQGWFDPQKF